MKTNDEKSESEKSEFMALFEQGYQLVVDDQGQAAVDLFTSMLERWPHSIPVWLYLGNARFKLDQWELSAQCFEHVTQTFPGKEYPSRGLFLSLWNSGKVDEAYAERERFVFFTGHYSEEYELYLRDCRGEVSAEEYDRIADEIAKKRRTSKGK